MPLFGFLKKDKQSPQDKSQKKNLGYTQEVIDLPLGEKRFRDLLLFTEEKEIKPRLPSLNGCRALEIAPRHQPLSPLLKTMNPMLIARVGGQREKDLKGDAEEAFVFSHWESLPFVESSWDFILLRPAFSKISLGRILREASRVLKPGGMILLSDFHPFSTMTQKEHMRSPVGEDGLGPGFERYDKFFREAGLSVDFVKEMFFDGSVRKFFDASASDKELFESLRRTPFLIFFLLQKE